MKPAKNFGKVRLFLAGGYAVNLTLTKPFDQFEQEILASGLARGIDDAGLACGFNRHAFNHYVFVEEPTVESSIVRLVREPTDDGAA